MLSSQAEGDRTKLYREREARESFVAQYAEEDQGALFANLGIRVTLREAARPDLQRVTELINRTNQFNLAGSRTTFGEISRWYDDPAHSIVVVEATDKFGQMGLICVSVLRREGEAIHIPIFVLSCRVFGYGIETTVLNAIKRMAMIERGDRPWTLLGVYKETSHNAPCRSMYPDNGFAWEGFSWANRGDEIAADPVWLTVEDRITPRTSLAERAATTRP